MVLLPWGDIFHDFLDRLGISLEQFRDEFTGSWMFGYAAALSTADIDTLIVCPTTKIRTPLRAVHAPTGAGILLLPAARVFGMLRRHALPDRLGDRRDPVSLGRAIATHVAPYFGTPPFALARTLRRESCSAVLCQEYETPRFDVAVAVGRALGVPTFATFQGGDYQMSRIERVVRPFSLRACAGLIVGPEDEAVRLRRRYGMPGAGIVRIFNPIDVSIWRPGDRDEARAALGIPRAASVVAWHGQVQIWRKGLDVMLRAWAEVASKRRGRDLRLLLVGSGEDSSAVRVIVETERLDGVTLFDRWVQDRARIREVLSAADVYVFPSRHEGFPVAPIEAMACALPVVAADAQGVRDVLAECGVVVKRGDPAALANALGELLDDGERRRELGRAARRRTEMHFSLQAVGSQLRAFLIDRTLGPNEASTGASKLSS